MGYAQRLINRILADERSRKNSFSDQKVYHDEPILRTGADLLRERERAKERRARQTPGGQRRAPDGNATKRPGRWTREMGSRPIIEVQPETDALRYGSRRNNTPGSVAQRTSDGRFSANARPAVELPDTLRQLRALEKEADAFILAESQLFVQQARLAASYEDDYVYEGTFHHYFPTYRCMSDEQLRGYFSWRTQVRRGNVVRASTSFAYVHLYELVNSIGPEGVMDPKEGLAALEGFVRAYAPLDEGILRYARRWCADYAIYHGLADSVPRLCGEGGLGNVLKPREGDPSRNGGSTLIGGSAHDGDPARGGSSCGGGPSHDGESARSGKADPQPNSAKARPFARDEALATLLRLDEGAETDDAALFEALATLSSYRIEQSRLNREEGEILHAAACETWRALAAYYRTHRKSTLVEHLFGVKSAQPYAMFRSAVFRPEAKHADTVVEAGPITRFICENGRWRCERFHNAARYSRELGNILKQVDGTLRAKLGRDDALKAAPVPKYMQRMIDKAVDALIEERAARERAEEAKRQESARREIVIDFSRLGTIRREAAASCEALLVDEERGEDAYAPANGACEQTASPVRAGSASVAASSECPETIGCGAADSLAADASALLVAASAAQPAPEAAQRPDSALLDENEAAYARCLLKSGGKQELAAIAKTAGVPESMLVDAVNEKLYDVLGDIAIEDAGDGPVVIEDYLEDVRGIVEV